MIYFQDLTRSELETILLPLSRVPRRPSATPSEIEDKRKRQARYRAKQIFRWVYVRYVSEWDEMTDLSKDLRQWLKENVSIYVPGEKVAKQSSDGTAKFLWELRDQKTIESVVIPAALKEKSLKEWKSNAGPELEDFARLTACISSQVGCAMGCKFCLTGIQGLDRHLQTHEIVAQVLELRKRAPITNIVFMGMGEPLHNLDNVSRACEILLDENGLNFSKRKVTVSTSGLVPAIRELGKRVEVQLAVSLNGSTDEQRSKIMPVNHRWPISELLKACREFPVRPTRRITFEYVLIRDLNDSLEDAKRLIKLLRGIPFKVNLIPMNEHSGSEYKRPSDERIEAFQQYLMDREVTATVRMSRGPDILAACGQLRSLFGTARGTERHTDYVLNA